MREAPRQLQSVDCLKGLLCLMIFGHHAANAMSRTTGAGGLFAQYGNMAVSFFFVISGALIALHYRPIENRRDWFNIRI